MADRPTSPFSPIPVSLWNKIVNMVRWWERTYAYGGTTPTETYENPTDFILIGNDTADDLVKGNVLQLSTKMLDAIEDSYPPKIVGVKCTVANKQIAVLKRPVRAKSGSSRAIVWGQIAGICFVKVNVIATWHPRAYPEKDSYVLKSGLFGPAEILCAPTSTGEQLVACRVGHASNRGMFAKTTSSITAATLSSGRLVLGSGTATIYDPYSTAGQYEASHTATIYNMAGDAVATDGYVFIVPTDDWLPVVDIDPCTQPT